MTTTKEEQGMVIIPQDTFARMNTLLSFTRLQKIKGKTDISLDNMADSLGLQVSDLNADLTLMGISDGVRHIFSVGALIDGLEVSLGYHHINEAFLVGAGRLGNILLQYGGFKECGLRIVAAFDVKPSLVGTEIESIKVLNPTKINTLADRMHIALGLIATPSDQAQKTADLLVNAGIRVIWNFSLKEVTVPEGVILESSLIQSDLKATFTRINERFTELLKRNPETK